MGLGYDGIVPDNWHAISQNERTQPLFAGNCISMRETHISGGERMAQAHSGNRVEPLAGEVIDRMRSVVGVGSDVELAERLNVGRSAPGNWRNRNKIPFDECLALAAAGHASLDWLMFGGAVSDARGPVDDAPAGHVLVNRLKGFDTTPGQDALLLPEVVLRRRRFEGDIGALRWLVNPTDALAPRLPQGGLLLVDSAISSHEQVVDGETYVVRMWGRVNVRRIFIIGPNEYRLRGEKEMEERRDLTGPDYKHLEIGGRVVDVI